MYICMYIYIYIICIGNIYHIYKYTYRISKKNYNNLFATLSFMYFTFFRQMSDVITNILT